MVAPMLICIPKKNKVVWFIATVQTHAQILKLYYVFSHTIISVLAFNHGKELTRKHVNNPQILLAYEHLAWCWRSQT